MPRITTTILWLCLLALPVGAAAGRDSGKPQWWMCPVENDLPERPDYSIANLDPGSTEIRADNTRIVKNGLTYFSGNVELVRDAHAARSDSLTYDDANSVVDFEGHAYLWASGLIWQGESGKFDLGAKTSRLEGGRYRLTEGRGQGLAGLITRDEHENITRLTDVDYTTCPGPTADWKFSAGSIKLDHNTDRGSAMNALLRVRDVPVFYVPYINFPLSDRRKSGFLFPTFGTSNESGADVRVPYYVNIAANHDATITPRFISDRGAMLGGEYRYLYRHFDGEFNFEYLPNDDLRGGRDRSFVSYQHFHHFAGTRGYARILLNNVSDAGYFEDFGQAIGVTSQRFLDRRMDIRYWGERIGLIGLVQSYQTIDESLRSGSGPYRRLPQLYFWTTNPYRYGNLLTGLRAETTYFSRTDSVSGARLHVEPALSFPINRTYARLVPRIAVRHTQYLLDQPQTFDDRESRTVPIFSVDSYLFAERRFSLFGSGFLQTLEPRAYYLLIPKQQQEDIPIFDTGLFDLSFWNLFRDDRFTGRDRVGDANQLSLAVTSRVLSQETGREALRASLGQILYFRDREVTLPRRLEEDDSTSELIAEVAARVNNTLSIRGTLQFDPNDSETQKGAVAMRYQPTPGAILNLGYRLRRAVTRNTSDFRDVDQTDVSMRLPLTAALSLVGRWNYSLETDQSLEAMGGLEYESCCWGVRLVSRRFIRNTEGEFDSGMFVQFELKGLAGIGEGTESFIRKSIPGYESYF